MARLSNPADAGKSESFYRVLAPPSGAEQWTAAEVSAAFLAFGADCCCDEIHPSDRPCLACEANGAPPTTVQP